MEIVQMIVAFAAGCVVWNYLGTRIKGELHAEEKKLGAEIVQLKDKQ